MHRTATGSIRFLSPPRQHALSPGTGRPPRGAAQNLQVCAVRIVHFLLSSPTGYGGAVKRACQHARSQATGAGEGVLQRTCQVTTLLAFQEEVPGKCAFTETPFPPCYSLMCGARIFLRRIAGHGMTVKHHERSVVTARADRHSRKAGPGFRVAVKRHVC